MNEQIDSKTEDQVVSDMKAQCMQWCREKRDQLLAQTDYIHLPDVTLPEEYKAALVAYRQSLRDYPAVFEQEFDAMTMDQRYKLTPLSLNFPIKPEAV